MFSRETLERAFRVLAYTGLFAIMYVVVDFSIDMRPAGVESSYQFMLTNLADDEPVILRQDNLSILVIKRSKSTVAGLVQAQEGLQDALSEDSRQPAAARNRHRSIQLQYFVSYALGTHLGCPLILKAKRVQESCSSASYDFAGRALVGDSQFQNLTIPDYNFDQNFSLLTINP
ncbi:MAG: Rieske Fe-S protein [Gammaproteobacteria bacterium]